MHGDGCALLARRRSRHVPVDRLRESLLHAACGAVAEQPLRLGDVRLRVAHVTAAEVTMHGRHPEKVRASWSEQRAQYFEQRVESGALVQRDVVNMVEGM